MQIPLHKLKLATLLFIAAIHLVENEVNAQSSAPPDAEFVYREYFRHYVDKRSLPERFINLLGATNQPIGRSFALVAGVYHYPNLRGVDKHLTPSKVDLANLITYLREHEYFDEIVVLENEQVNLSNIAYFLQTYFPERLRSFPKSRFVFAYSGHGIQEGDRGYLLQSNARSFNDKSRSISLKVVRSLYDEIVDTAFHSLALINACYSGAFHRRQSFGRKYLPTEHGAHAITAGGTNELTWHDKSIGPGSIFFEKFFAGLDGRADTLPIQSDGTGGDGITTVDELAAYLKQEVKLETSQLQNPYVSDISRHGSKGSLFFYDRSRQVVQVDAPVWDSSQARVKAMGKQDSRKIFDWRSLRAKVSEIRLYESPAGDISKKDRQYFDQFPYNATRYVNWELHLEHEPVDRRTAFDIKATWYKPNGELIPGDAAKKVVPTYVDPGWKTSWHSSGLGWTETDKWVPGRYRIDFSVGNTKIASKEFDIQAPTGFISEINAKVESIKFFESPYDTIRAAERQYANEFLSSKTRYIGWEVKLRHPAPGVQRHFDLRVRWRDPELKHFGSEWKSSSTIVDPTWRWSRFWSTRGWRQFGNFRPGKYRVFFYSNDILVGEAAFNILYDWAPVPHQINIGGQTILIPILSFLKEDNPEWMKSLNVGGNLLHGFFAPRSDAKRHQQETMNVQSTPEFQFRRFTENDFADFKSYMRSNMKDVLQSVKRDVESELTTAVETVSAQHGVNVKVTDIDFGIPEYLSEDKDYLAFRMIQSIGAEYRKVAVSKSSITNIAQVALLVYFKGKMFYVYFIDDYKSELSIERLHSLSEQWVREFRRVNRVTN